MKTGTTDSMLCSSIKGHAETRTIQLSQESFASLLLKFGIIHSRPTSIPAKVSRWTRPDLPYGDDSNALYFLPGLTTLEKLRQDLQYNHIFYVGVKSTCSWKPKDATFAGFVETDLAGDQDEWVIHFRINFLLCWNTIKQEIKKVIK